MIASKLCFHLKRKKEKTMYCKTQQNILIWGDRVTPYWLQETTSDDQERILFLFSVEIKNKERNKKFRATKQSWHSGKQASFAFTRILFIPKSKCLSPFLKCKKDQLHPTLLTTFIPPFTLFLHPRPLLHLPVCSSWMSFFFLGLLYQSGRILNPWVTSSP